MNAPPSPDIDWVVVGHVRGAFGVRGEIKVEPISDVDDTVLFDVPDWRIRSGDRILDCEVTSVRVHGRFLIAQSTLGLQREDIDALKGSVVEVDRSTFPEPESGEFYWADLIGCETVNTTGESLGRVVGVDEHGAHSVLRLEDGLLIPFVEAHVLDVDCASGRIVVDWSSDWR